MYSQIHGSSLFVHLIQLSVLVMTSAQRDSIVSLRTGNISGRNTQFKSLITIFINTLLSDHCLRGVWNGAESSRLFSARLFDNSCLKVAVAFAVCAFVLPSRCSC
jgi:hypothetical protein